MTTYEHSIAKTVLYRSACVHYYTIIFSSSKLDIRVGFRFLSVAPYCDFRIKHASQNKQKILQIKPLHHIIK